MSCFPTPLIIWGYVKLLGCVSLFTLICIVKIKIKIVQLFMGFFTLILLLISCSYPLHNLLVCSFQIISFVCKSFVLQVIPQLGLFLGGLYAGSSLLCGLFSSCDEQGLLSSYKHRLLSAVASLVAECELRPHELQQLQLPGYRVQA